MKRKVFPVSMAFLWGIVFTQSMHSLTLGICMGLLMGITFGLFDSGRGGNEDEGMQMHLINIDDFETVKNKYIGVIENTPDIEKYAQWVYGKHPTDELLKAYIDRGEMYVLMDGEAIAGMVAVAMCQGDDYLRISWSVDLQSDEVATVHLLAVCPDYRGKALGIRILEDAMEIAVKNGKKALRLDALKSNLPAQKMYEKAGFVYMGEQRLYAENTGMTEFVYYEKIPKEN